MSEQDVTLEPSYLGRMSEGLGDEGPALVLEEAALSGNVASGADAREAVVSEFERLAAALRALRPSYETPPSA